MLKQTDLGQLLKNLPSKVKQPPPSDAYNTGVYKFKTFQDILKMGADPLNYYELHVNMGNDCYLNVTAQVIQRMYALSQLDRPRPLDQGSGG